jgi:hypothetical protein
MDQNGTKARLMEAFRQFASLDLRFSHVALAAAIVLGALINLFLPHGWTVWPAILAFGILTYMNESVSRNCQGFPPYHVYIFFFGAIAAWSLIVLVLSAVNPVILFLGIGAILFRIIEALLRQRQREQLIATRRLQGVCLHCGGPYDQNVVFCETCGEEPNPDEAILKRVAQIYRSNDQIERARSALVRTTTPTTASSKEQALLARHRTGKVTREAPLPKAAKLGPSRSAKRRG